MLKLRHLKGKDLGKEFHKYLLCRLLEDVALGNFSLCK